MGLFYFRKIFLKTTLKNRTSNGLTSASGVASFDDVLIGTGYTLEEVGTPERYIVPDNQTAAIEWNKITNKSFDNDLKRGDLKVTKTAEDGLNEGLKFHLYGTSYSGIPVDEYAVTDASGVATFSNILIGTGYTLEEVDTPIRYVVPDNQTAAIEWNKVTNKSFDNVLKKWNLTVTKQDVETGSAQGDANLAGAKYGIYKGDELIDTYVTDADGKFTTKYYICGNDWSIKELDSSEGYLVTSGNEQIGVDPKNYTAEYNSEAMKQYEQVKKGNIAIIKHTDDGQTQIETPEEGAEFAVYLKSAGSYDNAKDSERDYLICDENGFAQTKDLPYGRYTVQQIKGWEGRELLKPFDVFVSENGETYVCCYAERVLFYEQYLEAQVSDDFAEIVKLYGERVTQAADEIMKETEKVTSEIGMNDEITAKDCKPISHDDAIEDKVIVIRGNVLRPEFRHASHQLMLCTGGFGAQKNARGRTCYCISLYSGKQTSFYRGDVLGVMEKQNTVRQRKKVHQQATTRETASTGGEVRRNAVRGKRNQSIKTAERTEHTIKQSARSAGKKTVKTGAKGTVKSSEKAIKTAEKTSKAAIKTAEKTAKATQKAAQATAKAAQKAAEMARQAAIEAYKAAVAAAKAIAAAIKAIAAAIKELIAAIAAGGWVAVVVIVVICLIALIVASCFGIFFSSEDTGSTQTMQQVVQEINMDYQNQLDDIKNSHPYDELEMSGSRAVWPEVLSIYAVKTTNDPENPQEVASMTDEKKQLLKDIFWEMNEISYETEEKTETVIVETDDGEGNIIEEEVEETTVYLYITVSHKSVEEMMAQYGFTEDQKAQVAELLAQDGSMWAAVLYGIYGADDQIVAVALSQIGNVGGEPYWSWYGFSSRVEWCACFVSWCADQCGYIETGVIPKYAGCVNGVNWFKDRGQWADNDIEPASGMIIFFDWDNKGSSGPQDGESDHTGIVERVEDGIVYTIEGNSGDSCRENHYAVGYYEILGYGIPAF